VHVHNIKDLHLEYSRQFDRVYFEILFTANRISVPPRYSTSSRRKSENHNPATWLGGGKMRGEKNHGLVTISISLLSFEGAALQGVDLVVRD